MNFNDKTQSSDQTSNVLRENNLFKFVDQLLSNALEMIRFSFSSYPLLTVDLDNIEFTIFLMKLVDKIEKQDDYKNFKKYLESKFPQDFSQLIGTSQSKSRLTPSNLLIDMIRNYISKNRTFEYEQKLAERIFLDLEKFLLDNTVTGKEEATIIGLDPKLKDTISLSSGLKIKYSQQPIGSELYGGNHIATYDFETLKIREKEENQKPDLPIKLSHNKIFNFIFAMRLYKSGKIGTDEIKISTNFVGGQFRSKIRGFNISNSFGGDNYVLEKGDIEKIEELMKKYENMEKPTFLITSINRFLSSYEQSTPEDQILDLIISLEALLLPDDKELSFRLAIHTALFLEPTSFERNYIYNIIRQSYGIRSTIAHGSEQKKIQFKIQNEEINIRELVKKLQNCVRKSIRKFIELDIDSYKKRSSLVTNLDNNLFLN